jgi:hypothetical protein
VTAPTAALAMFCDAQLDITPIASLPDGRPCDVCRDRPAVMRVYGSPQPCWVWPNPFTYAECCLDCGALCASLAVVQRSDADLITVELAADVWSCRDDTGDC